jgi:hypothetical protein
MKLFRWQGVLAFALFGGLIAAFMILFLKFLTLSIETFVFGKSDNIIYLITLTPRQHLMALEPAISAKNNFHLGPGFAQFLDQQGKNRPSVFGSINLARAKVTD